MNDLISIIIPCYNCENTIQQCIKSVFYQTYDNYEIICIDDGSTDNTIKKIEEFNYDNLRILSNSVNKGVSYSRNVGIKQARGVYICFIDSDDTICNNYLECLYNSLKRNNADISVSAIITNNEFESVINREKYISESLLNNNIAGYVWNKMYKRDLIYNCLFDEDISMNEDLLFNVKVANKTKIIACINKELYQHNKKNDQSLSQRRLNDRKITSIEAYNRIIDIVEKEYLDDYKVAMYRMMTRLKTENTSYKRIYNKKLNKAIKNHELRKITLCYKNLSIISKARLFLFDFCWYIVVLIRNLFNNGKEV